MTYRDKLMNLCDEVIADYMASSSIPMSKCATIAQALHAILSVEVPKEVAEIEARHAKVKAKWDEWLFSNRDIHPLVAEMPITIYDANDVLGDRAVLLFLLRAEMAKPKIPEGCVAVCDHDIRYGEDEDDVIKCSKEAGQVGDCTVPDCPIRQQETVK